MRKDTTVCISKWEEDDRVTQFIFKPSTTSTLASLKARPSRKQLEATANEDTNEDANEDTNEDANEDTNEDANEDTNEDANEDTNEDANEDTNEDANEDELNMTLCVGVFD
ncbi:hypothetical protein EDD37DRAFT_604176 [Exophiala viscosa]|uniref:uncharacterized protein n=1 Tax=Exophiala viscosa TaxID=2486360 RepID=UPI002199D269|nr:hypothetical protein EDD37DRAFT_604176 [Exophiala viscosa]